MENQESADPESRDYDKEQDGVDGKLGDLLVHTVSFGQHNRIYIIALTVSLIIDILLSVALCVVAIQAREASDKAAKLETVIRVTCESTNEARSRNLILWYHILDLPASPDLTDAQRKQAADFRTFVTGTFFPRDCNHL